MKKLKINIKTDYGIFECVFEPDEVGYVVTCLSVEGVVSWGKNLSEAKKMAKEAVELCIEAKVQENIGKGKAARPVIGNRLTFR
ncbi:MAG: type II toxin-antitoxin system HicB family antitoxin [Patescibacteria group bacterium]